LGWQVDVTDLIRRGLRYLEDRFRRPDGFYRTLVSASGEPLSDAALLYDQAFVLLGYAAAARALDDVTHFERKAIALWDLMEKRWRTQSGGFLSGDNAEQVRLSNPHMHLLEACIAWQRIGAQGAWKHGVKDLAELATAKLADPLSGSIYETYDANWHAQVDALDRRVVEPGHQFEWAWLLLQCTGERASEYHHAALRLIAFAERHGILNKAAINSIFHDGSSCDANARLWAQTERLKALVLAHELTGDVALEPRAIEAAATLMAYLDTPTAGMWHDQRNMDGSFESAPSPASSFYHIVSAIKQLDTSAS
jgi:mannose/cellobiose epimerase-like protein (N-acyl-D-glucosamine 2-epimerase family)